MTEQKDVLKRALDAIDALSAKLAASEARAREPIAVVGMGCRMPGGVNTPAEYWSLLREGRGGIREIPGDRWDVDAYYDPDPGAPGKMYTKQGGFLDSVDTFDAPFFGIAPREAITLDPQHRLLLECAWEALEDAGVAPDRLTNTATGVYVGITTSDYARLLRGSGEETDVYSASGTALNAAAGRISFALGLQGPSMAIDTACSSSLVAAHVAVQALRAGECDVALVGGVNAIVAPDAYVLFSKWGMISPTGECRTFDADANGFVRGEGCGVLVLRRLRDAQADGSRILAVIRGSAVNQDGPSSGLSVPNGLAQAKVIRRALENAGVAARDVGYVEAHGTGTIIGDPIEVEALGEVYGAARTPGAPLLLGSVKPSIGHLESAAGVAGLMKLVLMVGRGEIPPQRNFRAPNPRIEWDRLPIRIAETLQTWPAQQARIAAVSGFGFSGTNVHMVVEAPPPPTAGPAARAAQVLPLSARTDAALRDSARRLAAALEQPDAPQLADVARTLSTGRAQLGHRAIVVGSDRATVRTRLADLAAGEPGAGTRTGVVTERATPRIAFLYTGQGAQYAGMGLQLRDAFPVFREAFDRCDELLRRHGGPALLDILRAGGNAVHETGVTQPALFALEYALTQLVQSWGVTPSAVLGHSVGEYTAACVAGVMPLEDALRLIAERGRLMQSLPAGGGMLAVAADADTALAAATGHAEHVSLAARNGPRDVVLSGDAKALGCIGETLRGKGVDVKSLTVSHAFHSPLVEPILDEFERFAAQFSFATPRVPLVSNLSGRADATAGGSAQYWRRHVREPVNYEASIRHLVDDGYRVFLELGPKPVLLGMARRFLDDGSPAWIPTLRARPGEVEDVLEAVGSLFTVGVRPNWEGVLEGAGRRVRLPTYPFQRKRHWVSAPAPAPTHIEERPDDHPLLGHRLASPLRDAQFACTLDPVRRPILGEHRVAGSIIVPAAAYIEMACAAAAEVLGSQAVRIEGGYLKHALVLDEQAGRESQLIVSGRADGATFEVFSRRTGSDDAWVSHAGGGIAMATPPATGTADNARAGCNTPVDVDAYQQRMRDVGLDYGPSFRALVTAWRGEGEAFGELRLPDGDTLHGRVGVHPGLLDAAFHLIGIVLPEGDEERFYLPVRFEAAQILAPAGARATAHVRLRNADDRSVSADVTIWRDDGQPVAIVSGLAVRPVTRAQFRSSLGLTDAPALLRVDWRDAQDTEPAPLDGAWVVLGGDAVLAADVAADLRAAGADVAVPEEATDWTPDAGVRGIIDLRPTTLAPFDATAALPSELAVAGPVAQSLGLLRHLAVHPPAAPIRVLLATTRAQTVTDGDLAEPLGATVWGMAATAATETGLDVRLIDIDGAGAAPAIVHAARRQDRETRLAVRNGSLRAPRLVPANEPARGQLALPDGPYVIGARERGSLDGLGVQPAARLGPGAGQVEIEVLASGLNFRDVLNLLDMYPGTPGPLGNECCGRVVALGAGVNGIAVGDLVTCIADATFASHVVAQAALTFPVPPALSAAQAAGFPIAQLTAYLALHHVGRMRAGDRVLIHAGAGGVGLAAVHMALAAGARVIATAGSEEKRDYLRSLGVHAVLDSRRPAGADALRDESGGDGIDLLLNSLTGEFIDEGIRALAPGGRFLEIGLRELRSDEQVQAIRDDVSYHPLLLGDLCRDQPETVRAMWDAICALLADGRIPPPRVRSFPVSECGTAFRYMAKARHIGRVAITHPAAGSPHARNDAAYLVTGGLGALGLQVAEWLAAEGAGHLTLLGRSAPSAEAEQRLAALRAGGTTIEIVHGDVAEADTLGFLREPGRPLLRGVVHAAGVVDDAVLPRVDAERLARGLRPKADGAVNLARATREQALDFFVLFSSGSALLGSPGQAVYAGANAYLDGLAHRMAAEGVAALSIDWGAWAGRGMAAGVDARTAREWAERGVGMLSAEAGIALLDEALRGGHAQVAALPLDWPRFIAAIPEDRRPALLAELGGAGEETAAPTASGTVSIREWLSAQPASERLGALTERLRREAAAVLGAADPTDLEPGAGLMEQGLDSLMAVDLSGRLGRLLGVSLPTTFAFEYPTLNALASHLLAQVLPTEPPRAATVAPANEPESDVDTLSDTELEAELRRELDQAGF